MGLRKNKFKKKLKKHANLYIQVFTKVDIFLFGITFVGWFVRKTTIIK